MAAGVDVGDLRGRLRGEARNGPQLELAPEQARRIRAAVGAGARNARAEEHRRELLAGIRRASESIADVAFFARGVVEQRSEAGVRKGAGLPAGGDELEREERIADAVPREGGGVEVGRRVPERAGPGVEHRGRAA